MARKKNTAVAKRLPVSVEMIERRIYLIRGTKVMLDSDLADLYQVETKALNRAVRRNVVRFPEDFMFQLSEEEAESLRCQIGTSNGRGGRRYLPYVFTEHGVVMLSSVLSSERAVQMNVLIVRAFVKLREMLGTHKDLANKIAAIERQQHEHGRQLAGVYTMVRRLMEPPRRKKRQIGFRVTP
ncbi:MAG: ORF6N domain-containing protein [Bryobacteraceae bacterium]